MAEALSHIQTASQSRRGYKRLLFAHLFVASEVQSIGPVMTERSGKRWSAGAAAYRFCAFHAVLAN
jgi:hypothetical protein